MLNFVHHMHPQQYKDVRSIRSPEILNQIRQNIIFSGREIKTFTEEEDASESQLSSPEMNCTKTDSKLTTKDATMKTKDQKEIQAIIATTKQFTCSGPPTS